jgi:hypothetical protein
VNLVFFFQQFVAFKEEGPILVTTPRQQEHITFLACVCAAGNFLSPYLIYSLPPQRCAEYTFNDVHGPVVFNQSGWVDKEVKLEWAKWIVQFLPQNGLKVIFCDNHSSNFSEEIREHFLAHNTVVETFPAHLTHLLQPLDLSCFAHFKRELKHACGLVRVDKGQLTLSDSTTVIYGAMLRSFDPLLVRRGWIQAGLVWQQTTASSTQRTALEVSQQDTNQATSLAVCRRTGCQITSTTVGHLLHVRTERQRSRPRDSDTTIIVNNFQQQNFVQNVFIDLSSQYPTPPPRPQIQGQLPRTWTFVVEELN